jgi:hypothetical protein
MTQPKDQTGFGEPQLRIFLSILRSIRASPEWARYERPRTLAHAVGVATSCLLGPRVRAQLVKRNLRLLAFISVLQEIVNVLKNRSSRAV